MKRLTAFVLCLLLLTGMLPVEVFAQEQKRDELFDHYVMGLFYEGYGAVPAGDLGRDQLGKPARKLYDYLKEMIVKVASGEQSSTSCTVTLEQVMEWGGSGYYPGKNIDASMEACLQEFEFDKVLEALLHDCPYELYWYDKLNGCCYSFVMFPEDGGFSLVSMTFSFLVVRDHQASGYTEMAPKVKTSRAAAAVAAAENARTLVKDFAGKGDYAKLKAYKEEICDLVSYNNSAAHNGYFSQDADPWQLVYVFDGNINTNVVCEGYAKAFQYLCDQSTFRGDVKCYTVSGWASADGGWEGHMWNIVSIGGKQYLADITNSDAGTIGVEGTLFLAGASGSVDSAYRTGGMIYDYDICTEELWGTGSGSILKLASSKYDPNSSNKISAPKIKASNKADSGKPKISWSKVDGAVKYEVYRSKTGKDGSFGRISTVTGTSLTNKSAEAGTKYYYKVRAVGADGDKSNFSNVVSRTCDLSQPVVKTSNDAATGKVKLTWNEIEGAKSYKIYRATSKTDKYSLMKTVTGTSYINNTSKAGKTYYYKVVAVHENSNANSAYSAIVSRMCDLARPSITVKRNSSGKPRISWEKVDGAVKYEVWRATSKNGKYTKLITTKNLYQVNKNAKAGVTYYYKVKAIYSNTNANSAFSLPKYCKAK